MSAAAQSLNAVKAALANLLERIDSEPTMSGHLRGMRLRPDYGESHATSDAIRAATVALIEDDAESSLVEALQAELATEKAAHLATLEMAASPTWPFVLAFAKQMEAKLAKNRHKGDREGWINDTAGQLFARLGEEKRELELALKLDQPRPYERSKLGTPLEEAADVANFAMMIADVAQSEERLIKSLPAGPRAVK